MTGLSPSICLSERGETQTTFRDTPFALAAIPNADYAASWVGSIRVLVRLDVQRQISPYSGKGEPRSLAFLRPIHINNGVQRRDIVDVLVGHLTPPAADE